MYNNAHLAHRWALGFHASNELHHGLHKREEQVEALPKLLVGEDVGELDCSLLVDRVLGPKFPLRIRNALMEKRFACEDSGADGVGGVEPGFPYGFQNLGKGNVEARHCNLHNVHDMTL